MEIRGISVALFAGLILLVISVDGGSDDTIVGADDSFLERFAAGDLYCKSSKGTGHAAEIYVLRDIINDNYCDCDDGIDEPGTSACRNGQFFCRSDGIDGKYLNASSVNDGVCDCCDGADEFDGRVRCGDNCSAVRSAELKMLEETMTSMKEGIKRKGDMEQEAEKLTGELEAEISSLNKIRDLAVANYTLAINIQRRLLMAKHAVPDAKLQEVEDKKQNQRIIPPSLARDTKPYNLNLTIPDDCYYMYKKILMMADLPLQILVNKVFSLFGMQSLVDKLFKSGVSTSLDIEELHECAGKAETMTITPEAKKDSAIAERNDFKLFFDSMTSSEEFARTPGFRALARSCMSAKFAEFVYEFCPFRFIKQYEEGKLVGPPHKWKDWNGPDQEYITETECMDGKRSVSVVKFKCGPENKLDSVLQVLTCLKHITVTSPAACEESDLQALQTRIELLAAREKKA